MARKNDLNSTTAATKPAVNIRGEAALDLGGGRVIKLKMTLAAMAEIEDAFAVESITEISQDALGSSRGVAKLVLPLAKAAGETVTEDEIRKAPVEIGEVMAAIQAAASQLRGAKGDDPGNTKAPSR